MHSIAIVLFKLPTLCLARRKVEEKRTLNPAQGCFWPSSVFSLFFFFFFPKNNWARFSSESLSVSSVFHCEVYWPAHCLTLWNVELSFYSPRGKGITWKLGDQCASKDTVELDEWMKLMGSFRSLQLNIYLILWILISSVLYHQKGWWYLAILKEETCFIYI